MSIASHIGPRRGSTVLLVVLAIGALGLLLALGTWQVQRLTWKESLLATIGERVASEPRTLSDVQTQLVTTGDIEYWPVRVTGTFRHDGERHFFATHQGQSGYYVYTPLEIAAERYLLVNRGFVPFDRKDASLRAEGQVEGEVTLEGLSRGRLAEKPSFLVPENDPDKNLFYWKDLDAMASSSGVAGPDAFLPFFVDAGPAANPGGLPVGGVTIIAMPNNHLQYAITWYGLALALVGVLGYWLWRGRRSASGSGA